MNVADAQKPAPGELFVDHVSHFVADLDAAARIFESLGMKVVRPSPEKMSEGRIQYVQQLTPEHVWRAGDVNPLRLEEVFVVAKNPTETAARWAHFGALIPRPMRDG